MNVIKIMGDICNLLFQNKLHLVASGLCTDSQYESDVIKLVDRIYRAIEQ